MRTDLFVVSPPGLDQDAGLLATAKPFEAQALVTKLVVETLVGRIFLRLVRVDVSGVCERRIEGITMEARGDGGWCIETAKCGSGTR